MLNTQMGPRAIAWRWGEVMAGVLCVVQVKHPLSLRHALNVKLEKVTGSQVEAISMMRHEQ